MMNLLATPTLFDMQFALYKKRIELRRKRLCKEKTFLFQKNQKMFSSSKNYKAFLVYGFLHWEKGTKSVMSESLMLENDAKLLEGDIVQECSDKFYLVSKVFEYRNELYLVPIHKTRSFNKHMSFLNTVTL